MSVLHGIELIEDEKATGVFDGNWTHIYVHNFHEYSNSEELKNSEYASPVLQGGLVLPNKWAKTVVTPTVKIDVGGARQATQRRIGCEGQ